MSISTQAALRAVLDEIRQRDHATAGFTTGLAGAAAAALGQAVVGISGGDTARLNEIVPALEQLADDDAQALGRYLELRELGREVEGWAVLQSVPLNMGDLACEAAEILTAFRPQVVDHVHDDMEFAIVLLTAAGRAALLIVESNLRQWRSPELHARFGPETDRLAARLAALRPVDRLAWR